MNRLLQTGAIFALTLSLVGASNGAEPDFEKDILPVFEKKCMSCHRAPYTDERGRTKKPKGGLRMDAKAEMDKGGDSGDAVKGKDLEASLVYQRVILDDSDDEFMPPKGDPLTPEEVEALKKWIEAGADYGKWEVTEFDEEGNPKK